MLWVVFDRSELFYGDSVLEATLGLQINLS